MVHAAQSVQEVGGAILHEPDVRPVLDVHGALGYAGLAVDRDILPVDDVPDDRALHGHPAAIHVPAADPRPHGIPVPVLPVCHHDGVRRSLESLRVGHHLQEQHRLIPHVVKLLVFKLQFSMSFSDMVHISVSDPI